MSEVYNPESDAYQKLESLELEARRIKRKVDVADSPDEREVLIRQLQETEDQIAGIKKRFRP